MGAEDTTSHKFSGLLLLHLGYGFADKLKGDNS
jgi:hypothetical protein